jgi:hypothetical protein
LPFKCNLRRYNAAAAAQVVMGMGPKGGSMTLIIDVFRGGALHVGIKLTHNP